MSLSNAKDFLRKYKEDNKASYINFCTFLELLVDFEQTSLEEILSYLELSPYPLSIKTYSSNMRFISLDGGSDNEYQTTYNILESIKKAEFSIVTGFSYETRERYKTFYFSLVELFQSETLQQINFKEKYSADEAMGRGFCYISKGSIGNIFKAGDFVTGLSPTRINELINSGHVIKVNVDSKIKLLEATGKQKEAIMKIHEHMDEQEKAYNSTPSHKNEISQFINDEVLAKNNIEDLTLKIEHLNEELEIEKNKNKDLQKIIDKSNLQETKPADDLKAVPHQAYRTLDKVMYAMAKITKLDNTKPYSQNTPSLNATITTILQNDGIPLEYEAVGKWLSRINDIKPLK